MMISQPAAGQRSVRAQPLIWGDAIVALGLGALSLALYVRTLATFPLNNDSAEFQVLAYQVGIAHTPGYPVYLLLAHLLTLLPVGDIAYRVNLFSACMAALAVAGVYISARLLAGSRLAAIFGALALAVSFTFWSQAIIAEVYTSGAAFVTLVWGGLLGWYRSGRRWPLFLAGLGGGLSLGVHSSVTLLAPAVLLFLWLNRRGRPRFWLAASAGAAIGVLLYLLAFVVVDLHAPPANIFNAAYAPARSSWQLSQADLDSPIQRMIFIGSATQWRSAMFRNLGHVPGRLFEYLRLSPREFAWPSMLLIAAGGLLLFRHERSLAWLFLVALLLQWAFVLTYQIGDYYVFYITGYLLMTLLAAYALAAAIEWLAARPLRGARALPLLAFVALLALGIWPQLAPYQRAVRTGSVPFANMQGYIIDDQTESEYRVVARVVAQLPQRAIVFVQWRQLYTYYYAAQVAQGRRDLRFIEPAPRADHVGLPDSTLPFIRDNIATHPIFFMQPWGEVEQGGFRFQPRDIDFTLLYQVERE